MGSSKLGAVWEDHEKMVADPIFSANNPIAFKDPNGRLPVIVAPLLLGAGAGVAGQFLYDVYSISQGNQEGFSDGTTYMTRAGQGALVALAGVQVAGASIAAQIGTIAVASAVTGGVGSAILGQSVTAQSVATDAIIGGTSFGLLKSVPRIPGRLPNIGTNAFVTGKHTQQSGTTLAVDAIMNYESSLIGNADMSGLSLSNTNECTVEKSPDSKKKKNNK
jgi:hypothetical protein